MRAQPLHKLLPTLPKSITAPGSQAAKIEKLYGAATAKPIRLGSPVIPVVQSRVFDVPTIIALTGHIGAGKTHVSNMLSMLGYYRLSFGAEIREIIYRTTDSHGAILDFVRRGNDHDINTPESIYVTLMDLYLSNEQRRARIFERPAPLPIRQLQQWLGTYYLRGLDPDFLVKALIAKYNRDKPKLIVIDDWRRMNEMKFWEGMKVNALRVMLRGERTESEVADHHEAESEIDTLPVDVYLENTPQNRVVPSTLDEMVLFARAQADHKGRKLTTSKLRVHRHGMTEGGSTKVVIA